MLFILNNTYAMNSFKFIIDILGSINTSEEIIINISIFFTCILDTIDPMNQLTALTNYHTELTRSIQFVK